MCSKSVPNMAKITCAKLHQQADTVLTSWDMNLRVVFHILTHEFDTNTVSKLNNEKWPPASYTVAQPKHAPESNSTDPLLFTVDTAAQPKLKTQTALTWQVSVHISVKHKRHIYTYQADCEFNNVVFQHSKSVNNLIFFKQEDYSFIRFTFWQFA
jgi:hypothetical protein